MDFQILIPQYKETDDVIKPLLDSIAIQQRISFSDFNVIICNDGSDIFLSNKMLKSYPFEIKYYKEPHRGVSGTRNALIDHATADYIMFCDADDMFFNAYGLSYIFKEIGRNDFDIYISMFLEELLTEDGYVFLEHKEDPVFIHGKVYRRQFIIDEGIRFFEELKYHEDSVFNVIARFSADDEKTRYCATPFYVWKWRNDSTCRYDLNYNQSSATILVDGNDMAVEALRKKGYDIAAHNVAVNHLIYMYYDLNKPIWTEKKNEKYLIATEKRLGEFYLKYKDEWDSEPDINKARVSEEMRAKSLSEGMIMERISLGDWIKHITKLARKK